jgi:hypothetical protein
MKILILLIVVFVMIVLFKHYPGATIALCVISFVALMIMVIRAPVKPNDGELKETFKNHGSE